MSMDEELESRFARLEMEIVGLKATLLVTNSRTVALESLVTEFPGNASSTHAAAEQIRVHLRQITVETCYQTLATLSDNNPRLATEVKALIDRLYGPRAE